jgi:type VI secretion system protein VasD
MNRTQRFTGLLCLALLISACKHAPPPPPAPPKPRILTLAVVSAADLNPDQDGRPSPVVVRLYQLSSTTDFANAEFEAVYPNDGAILAKTIVGTKQEVPVLPGQRTTIQIEFANEARALGILVAYQDKDHANWRVIGPATTGSSTLSLGAKSAQLVSSP